MDEEVFYNRGSVFISRTLIRIGGASYSVSNVGSVMIKRQNTAIYWIGALFFGLIALLFLVVTLNNHYTSFNPALVFLLFVALTMWPLYSALKPNYFLVLRTSSSDQSALSDRQVTVLQEISHAIERAMMARG